MVPKHSLLKYFTLTFTRHKSSKFEGSGQWIRPGAVKRCEIYFCSKSKILVCEPSLAPQGSRKGEEEHAHRQTLQAHVEEERTRARSTYEEEEGVEETWGAGVETQENKKIFVPLSKKDKNKKSNERWT